MKKINKVIAQFQEYVADDSRLKSNQLFINLQYELIGTENRIAVERMRYNQSVQNYNQSLNQFPNLIIAKPLRFEPKLFDQFD